MEKLFMELQNLLKTGQFNKHELEFIHTFTTKVAVITKSMLEKIDKKNGEYNVFIN